MADHESHSVIHFRPGIEVKFEFHKEITKCTENYHANSIYNVTIKRFKSLRHRHA